MGPREQFYNDHGADGITIGELLVFSDGARMEKPAFGLCYPPPEDLFERSKIIVAYCQEQVRRAVEKFRERKVYYAQLAEGHRHSGFAFTLSQQAIAELEQLRDEVRNRQKKLTTAQKQLERHTPPQIKHADSERVRSGATVDQFLEDLNKLRV